MHSSVSNEWGTPLNVIELARQVMGSIDLDPASTEAFNQNVRATRHYTAGQDGLAQPWYGNVFCNPPGGIGGVQQKWLGKCYESFAAEDVDRVVFLGFNISLLRTCQQQLREAIVCIPAKRLAFLTTVATLRGLEDAKPKPDYWRLERHLGKCIREGYTVTPDSLVPSMAPMYDNVIVGFGGGDFHVDFHEAFSDLGQCFRAC